MDSACVKISTPSTSSTSTSKHFQNDSIKQEPGLCCPPLENEVILIEDDVDDEQCDRNLQNLQKDVVKSESYSALATNQHISKTSEVINPNNKDSQLREEITLVSISSMISILQYLIFVL